MMPSACPLSELDVPGVPLVKSCAYQPPAKKRKRNSRSVLGCKTGAHARLARKRCSFNTAAELKNSSTATHKSKKVIAFKPQSVRDQGTLWPAHTTRGKEGVSNYRCSRAALASTAGGRGHRCRIHLPSPVARRRVAKRLLARSARAGTRCARTSANVVCEVHN